MKCFEESETQKDERKRRTVNVLFDLSNDLQDVIRLNLKTDKGDFEYWIERVNYALELVRKEKIR